MNIKEFLANPDWDTPFFKRLAHNDTGRAAGHQGGIVLPKDLRCFLPTLDESAISPITPTIDRYLLVEMFIGLTYLTNGVVRYQFQTWRGTRSPESRLTDGFRPILVQARQGDFLVFQRRSDALDYFRLTLVKQDTPEYNEISRLANNRRWGPLYLSDPPVTQSELTRAEQEVIRLANFPFVVQKSKISRVETRQNRIARSSAFAEKVRQEYGRKCAVSGIIIATPRMLYEVESAHVVPVSEGGLDDIRNGFALTQTLHWAFDQGLFGVDPKKRTIYIPKQVKQMKENAYLNQFEGRQISEAKNQNFRVHEDAFDWHFKNRVKPWD